MFRPLAAAMTTLALAVATPPAAASHRRLVVGYDVLPATGVLRTEFAFAAQRPSGIAEWRTNFACAVEKSVLTPGAITSASCQLWAWSAGSGWTTQGQAFPLTRWGEDNWAVRGEMWSLPAADDFRLCLDWTVASGGQLTTYRLCGFAGDVAA